MAAKGVYWVPTITVGLYVAPGRAGAWPKMAQLQRDNFPKAMNKGVKIALGTDAGGFDWKELNQAKEFEYYVQYGMTPMQSIHSGTAVAAELLGWSDKVGTIEAGKWADMVAVSGDPCRPPSGCCGGRPCSYRFTTMLLKATYRRFLCFFFTAPPEPMMMVCPPPLPVFGVPPLGGSG